MIVSSGFRLETTAPNSSFQIGIVERSHRTLGNMMHSMLLGAGLDATYWSDALLHSVYIKNRLPHHKLPNFQTPFEAWNNSRPNVSHLRVFGSLLCIQTPGAKDGKLDTFCVHEGMFVGFAASSRNVRYVDRVISQTKTAKHFTVDEAHFSSVDIKPPNASDLLSGSKTPPKDFVKAKLLPFPSAPRPLTTSPITLTPTAAALSSTPAEDSSILLDFTCQSNSSSDSDNSSLGNNSDANDFANDLQIIDNYLILSSSPTGITKSYDVRVIGTDEFLGFRFKLKDGNHIIIEDILPRTPADRVLRTPLLHPSIH